MRSFYNIQHIAARAYLTFIEEGQQFDSHTLARAVAAGEKAVPDGEEAIVEAMGAAFRMSKVDPK